MPLYRPEAFHQLEVVVMFAPKRCGDRPPGFLTLEAWDGGPPSPPALRRQCFPHARSEQHGLQAVATTHPGGCNLEKLLPDQVAAATGCTCVSCPAGQMLHSMSMWWCCRDHHQKCLRWLPHWCVGAMVTLSHGRLR